MPARSVDAAKTGDVFHSMTIGGAKNFGREEIGRLAVGAKADLVLVDARHSAMLPGREPLRVLIYSAHDRAVRDVYVDGQRIVADSKVLTMDYADAAGRLGKVQHLADLEAPKLDWAKRPMAEIAPPSLPVRP